MAVCKFYLNGYCKYGNMCRNEHYQNSNHNYNKYNKTYTKDQPNKQTSKEYNGKNNQAQSSNVFSFANTSHNKGASTTFSFNKAFGNLSNNNVSTGGFSFSGNQQPTNNSFFGNQQPKNNPFFGNEQPKNNPFFGNQQPNNNPFFGNQQSSQLMQADSSQTFSFNQSLNTIQTNPQPSMITNINRIINPFSKTSDVFSGNTSSFFKPKLNVQPLSSQANFGFAQSDNLKTNLPSSGSFFTKTNVTNKQAILNTYNIDANSPVYSLLNELSENDRLNYEQSEFTVIPLRPPAYEHCV